MEAGDLKKTHGPESHMLAAKLMWQGMRSHEAGARLGVHRSTIWRWSKTNAFNQAYEHEIRAYRFPRSRRYLEQMEALLESDDPFIVQRAAINILRVTAMSDLFTD